MTVRRALALALVLALALLTVTSFTAAARVAPASRWTPTAALAVAATWQHAPASQEPGDADDDREELTHPQATPAAAAETPLADAAPPAGLLGAPSRVRVRCQAPRGPPTG